MNAICRRRSGNPGYLMGFPVLFGALNSTALTILVAENGLTLSSGVLPLATCPSESTPAGSQFSAGVRFGYDSSWGCSLSLNRLVGTADSNYVYLQVFMYCLFVN
jgi:hypothetical protein